MFGFSEKQKENSCSFPLLKIVIYVRFRLKFHEIRRKKTMGIDEKPRSNSVVRLL